MPNDPNTLGLNPWGEPSETLRALDTMVRRVTKNAYGVLDLNRIKDGLCVTALDVEKACRGESDQAKTKQVVIACPDNFVGLDPTRRAAHVVAELVPVLVGSATATAATATPTAATATATAPAPAATTPAPSTKPRGLHERLGTESFRALRRGMRADWMAAHGLDEAPPSSPWLSSLERFWLLALGLPMPEGAYDPPASIAEYLAHTDAPDAIRCQQLKAADAVFCLPRDHSEVFAREGRECVFVAQPYFNDRLTSLTSLSNVWRDTASKHGLEFTFSLGHSWYDPGRSVLLALWLPGKAW